MLVGLHLSTYALPFLAISGIFVFPLRLTIVVAWRDLRALPREEASDREWWVLRFRWEMERRAWEDARARWRAADTARRGI